MYSAGAIIGRTMWLDLVPMLRRPGILVVASLAPLAIYLAFGFGIDDPTERFQVVSGYLLFSVVTSCMSRSAITVAADRQWGWGEYLQSLPAPAWPRILGQMLAAIIYTLATTLPMVVVFALTAPGVSAGLILRLILALIPAGLGFSFLGGVVGRVSAPESATYVVSAVYMLFAIAGGLFSGGQRLDSIPVWLFESMPSRATFVAFGDILSAANPVLSLLIAVGSFLLWAALIVAAAKLWERRKG